MVLLSQGKTEEAAETDSEVIAAIEAGSAVEIVAGTEEGEMVASEVVTVEVSEVETARDSVVETEAVIVEEVTESTVVAVRVSEDEVMASGEDVETDSVGAAEVLVMANSVAVAGVVGVEARTEAPHSISTFFI